MPNTSDSKSSPEPRSQPESIYFVLSSAHERAMASRTDSAPRNGVSDPAYISTRDGRTDSMTLRPSGPAVTSPGDRVATDTGGLALPSSENMDVALAARTLSPEGENAAARRRSAVNESPEPNAPVPPRALSTSDRNGTISG